MAADGVIEVRRLSPVEAREQLDGLAAVLADCVAGGASVSYMAPFTHEDARDAFTQFAAEVEQGRRLLLAAFEHGAVVGTVQVVYAWPPNQPHLLAAGAGEVTDDARHLAPHRVDGLHAGLHDLLPQLAGDEAESLRAACQRRFSEWNHMTRRSPGARSARRRSKPARSASFGLAKRRAA